MHKQCIAIPALLHWRHVRCDRRRTASCGAGVRQRSDQRGERSGPLLISSVHLTATDLFSSSSTFSATSSPSDLHSSSHSIGVMATLQQFAQRLAGSISQQNGELKLHSAAPPLPMGA